MEDAYCTVQYATDVSTLPQSYNCTIRFIKLKCISQAHRNPHVLPPEAPARVSLPPPCAPAAFLVHAWKFVHEPVNAYPHVTGLPLPATSPILPAHLFSARRQCLRATCWHFVLLNKSEWNAEISKGGY